MMNRKLIFPMTQSNKYSFDTVESFFYGIIFEKETLIIPYINLGICNHELNNSSRLKFIDFAYIIGRNVEYCRVNSENGEKVLFNDNDRELNSFHFGGENLYPKGNCDEIEFRARKSYLRLLPDSKISDSFWIPIDTPNFRKNIDENRLTYFCEKAHEMLASDF